MASQKGSQSIFVYPFASLSDMTAPAVEIMQPLELHTMLREGRQIFLLDVREPEEHQLVNISGCVLIPLMQLEEHLEEIRQRAASAELTVVYCRIGARSRIAVQWCAAQGISGLKNLRGGINAYALEADRSLTPY